jgi:hypothetical protein
MPSASFFLSTAIVGVFSYAYIFLLVIFGVTLKNTFFSGMRGRSWLALLGTAAAAWVLNILNFVLAPFGTLDRFGFIFNITLHQGLNAGAFVFILVSLIQIAALFIACSTLIEKRINLS